MTQVPKEIMDLEKKENKNQNLVQKKEQRNDIRRSLGDKMVNPYMAQKFDPYGQFMA